MKLKIMSKKITTEFFIDNAKLIHGDTYSYDNVAYKFSNQKVIITCSNHGNFEQEPNSHLKGKGCPQCGKNRKFKTNFIYEATLKHNNKFNYSMVIFKKVDEKVIIICPLHGQFKQTPHSHLSGYGCPDCGGNVKLTTESFIAKVNKIHINKYDYSLVDYVNNSIKVKIICPEHGVFEQRPRDHYKNACPICNESRGERETRNILTNKNINFISQYRFNDCKDKLPLPFDFYLPNHNICIEYQGIQHYKPIEHFGGKNALLEVQKRDKIKKEYCHNNNIPLIIIRYNENIKSKLSNLI